MMLESIPTWAYLIVAIAWLVWENCVYGWSEARQIRKQVEKDRIAAEHEIAERVAKEDRAKLKPYGLDWWLRGQESSKRQFQELQFDHLDRSGMPDYQGPTYMPGAWQNPPAWVKTTTSTGTTTVQAPMNDWKVAF